MMPIKTLLMAEIPVGRGDRVGIMMTRSRTRSLLVLPLLLIASGSASARVTEGGGAAPTAGETARQLVRAQHDGAQAARASLPSSAAAGRVFDGATARARNFIPPSPGPGGRGGLSRDRFAHARGLVDGEAPPPPEPPREKDATPYRWAIVLAMGAMAVALLLMRAAGKEKDAAKADPKLLASAAMLHWAAAAAASLAMAMGVIIMTGYGQRGQGLLWTAAGGLLAAFNARSAADASVGVQRAEEERRRAAELAAKRAAEERGKLAALFGKGMFEPFGEGMARMWVSAGGTPAAGSGIFEPLATPMSSMWSAAGAVPASSAAPRLEAL